MPVSYVIEDGVLFLLLEGEYESRDIETVFLEALTRIPEDENFYFLMDLSASTSLSNRPTDSIVQSSLFFSQYEHRFKRTALLAPGDLEFGMMRVAQSVGEMENKRAGVRAFRTTTEALAWLKKEE